MKRAPPLPVFLTVDTELWPAEPGWPERALPPSHRDFADEIAADVHGQTSAGGYGLPYQIGVLNRHGLRATYFVEALFAARAGIAPLAHIVRLVQHGGHEAQLHLHTEWLREIHAGALPPDLQPDWPEHYCQYLCQLPLRQQSALIRKGLALLAEAGVPRVHAFRAGSYGGNLDTLRALAANGIAIDSSYNPCHLSGDWGGRRIEQPQAIGGVWEFPVAALRDFPGHRRHAQLCACSFAELTHALRSAQRAGWPAFVIVLHSFELIRKHGAGRLATPDRLSIGRFEQLCAFLDQHREQFRTTLFSEVDGGAMPATVTATAATTPTTTASAKGTTTTATMASATETTTTATTASATKATAATATTTTNAVATTIAPAPPALRTRPIDTLRRVGQQVWGRFR